MQKLTATKLRHPIQLLSVSYRFFPWIHVLHLPSAMPLSNRGPANKMEVRNSDEKISGTEIGYQPSRLSIFGSLRWAYVWRTYAVVSEQTKQDTETQRIRARMIDGASRDKVGDGRVWGKK